MKMDHDSKMLAETYSNHVVREATAHSDLDTLMHAAFDLYYKVPSRESFEEWLKNNPVGHKYFQFMFQKLQDIQQSIRHEGPNQDNQNSQDASLAPDPPQSGWVQRLPNTDKQSSFLGTTPITRY